MSEHTGFHNREQYNPDCPKCEQDELLLTEIKEILIKPLKVPYQQDAAEMIIQGAIDQAEQILAKAKQHYEHQLLALIPDIEEAKREERERIIKEVESIVSWGEYEELLDGTKVRDGHIMSELWQALKGGKQ